MRCCSRKGERESEAGGLRVEAEDEMPKFKIQMPKNPITRNESRFTSTDNGHGHETRARESMSKFKVGNPWKTGKRALSGEERVFQRPHLLSPHGLAQEEIL